MMFGAGGKKKKKRKKEGGSLCYFLFLTKRIKGDHFDQYPFNSWTWYKINHSVVAIRL